MNVHKSHLYFDKTYDTVVKLVCTGTISFGSSKIYKAYSVGRSIFDSNEVYSDLYLVMGYEVVEARFIDLGPNFELTELFRLLYYNAK